MRHRSVFLRKSLFFGEQLVSFGLATNIWNSKFYSATEEVSGLEKYGMRLSVKLNFANTRTISCEFTNRQGKALLVW
jgi:hypothetical protein